MNINRWTTTEKILISMQEDIASRARQQANRKLADRYFLQKNGWPALKKLYLSSKFAFAIRQIVLMYNKKSKRKMLRRWRMWAKVAKKRRACLMHISKYWDTLGLNSPIVELPLQMQISDADVYYEKRLFHKQGKEIFKWWQSYTIQLRNQNVTSVIYHYKNAATHLLCQLKNLVRVKLVGDVVSQVGNSLLQRKAIEAFKEFANFRPLAKSHLCTIDSYYDRHLALNALKTWISNTSVIRNRIFRKVRNFQLIKRHEQLHIALGRLSVVGNRGRVIRNSGISYSKKICAKSFRLWLEHTRLMKSVTGVRSERGRQLQRAYYHSILSKFDRAFRRWKEHLQFHREYKRQMRSTKHQMIAIRANSELVFQFLSALSNKSKQKRLLNEIIEWSISKKMRRVLGALAYAAFKRLSFKEHAESALYFYATFKLRKAFRSLKIQSLLVVRRKCVAIIRMHNQLTDVFRRLKRVAYLKLLYKKEICSDLSRQTTLGRYLRRFGEKTALRRELRRIEGDLNEWHWQFRARIVLKKVFPEFIEFSKSNRKRYKYINANVYEKYSKLKFFNHLRKLWKIANSCNRTRKQLVEKSDTFRRNNLLKKGVQKLKARAHVGARRAMQLGRKFRQSTALTNAFNRFKTILSYSKVNSILLNKFKENRGFAKFVISRTQKAANNTGNSVTHKNKKRYLRKTVVFDYLFRRKRTKYAIEMLLANSKRRTKHQINKALVRLYLLRKNWDKFSMLLLNNSQVNLQIDKAKRARELFRNKMSDSAREFLERLFDRSRARQSRKLRVAQYGSQLYKKRVILRFKENINRKLIDKLKIGIKNYNSKMKKRVVKYLIEYTADRTNQKMQMNRISTGFYRKRLLSSYLPIWKTFVEERFLTQLQLKQSKKWQSKFQLNRFLNYWINYRDLSRHLMEKIQKFHRKRLLIRFLFNWTTQTHFAIQKLFEYANIDQLYQRKLKLKGIAALSVKLIERAHFNESVFAFTITLRKLKLFRFFNKLRNCRLQRIERENIKKFRVSAVYSQLKAIEIWSKFIYNRFAIRNRLQLIDKHYSLKKCSIAFGNWIARKEALISLITFSKKGNAYWKLQNLIRSISMWKLYCNYFHFGKNSFQKAKHFRLKKSFNLLRKFHKLTVANKTLNSFAIRFCRNRIKKKYFYLWKTEIKVVFLNLMKAQLNNPKIALKLKFKKLNRKLISRKRELKLISNFIQYLLRRAVNQMKSFQLLLKQRKVNEQFSQLQYQMRQISAFLHNWTVFAFQRNGRIKSQVTQGKTQKQLLKAAIRFRWFRSTDRAIAMLVERVRERRQTELKFLTCLLALEKLLFLRVFNVWNEFVRYSYSQKRYLTEESDWHYCNRLQMKGFHLLRERVLLLRSIQLGLIHYCKNLIRNAIRVWKERAFSKFHLQWQSQSKSHSESEEENNNNNSPSELKYLLSAKVYQISKQKKKLLLANNYQSRYQLRSYFMKWFSKKRENDTNQSKALKFIFQKWSKKVSQFLSTLKSMHSLKKRSTEMISLQKKFRFHKWKVLYLRVGKQKKSINCIVKYLTRNKSQFSFALWKRWTAISTIVNQKYQSKVKITLETYWKQFVNWRSISLSQKTNFQLGIENNNKLRKKYSLKLWNERIAEVIYQYDSNVTAHHHYVETTRKSVLFVLHYLRKMRLLRQMKAKRQKDKSIQKFKENLWNMQESRSLVVKANRNWLLRCFQQFRYYCNRQKQFHQILYNSNIIKKKKRFEALMNWHFRLRAARYLRHYQERLHVIHSERRLQLRIVERLRRNQLKSSFHKLLSNRTNCRKFRKSLQNINNSLLFDSIRKCFHKWDSHSTSRWARKEQERLMSEHCKHSCLVRGWRALLLLRKREREKINQLDSTYSLVEY